MSKPIMLLLAGACCCLAGRAAVPPPEQLLPMDTILVVTAPDWGKAWAFLNGTAYGRLWQDPAIKPFRDKLVEKFTTEVLTPAEQNFKIKFSDYQGLAQGQVTFAVIPAGQHDNPDFHFAEVLLVDTRDHADQLKNNLADIQKKWADGGLPMKAVKLRDIDFTTLIASPDDLSWNKIFQKSKPGEAPAAGGKPQKNVELTIGQSGSLLIVGDSTEAIEKVLSRQAGGLAPPLGDEADFQADYGARLRNSPIYAWINARALLEFLSKPPAGMSEAASADALKFNTLADLMGLGNLASACLSFQISSAGMGAELFVRVPDQNRHGLLKAFSSDPKDARPPGFVPADAVKFWRWRLNIPRSWAALEGTLNESNPALMATVNAALQMAGKDKDEHYDLKAELLENVGDDIISYQKAPVGNTLADLKAAPSIYMIGSPNPQNLATALKTGMRLLGRGPSDIKEREFLGRTINTFAMPAMPAGQAPLAPFNFSGSGGYLAMSTDASILEEFLRSSDSKAKALADMGGLTEAAQNVGGMATGWFGLDNQIQSMRPLFEVVRKQSLSFADILGTPQTMEDQMQGYQVADRLWSWADFSLLPSFDAVSKYFYYSVYSGSFSTEGFALKIFSPTPPQLR
jgi:hypothetical protein